MQSTKTYKATSLIPERMILLWTVLFQFSVNQNSRPAYSDSWMNDAHEPVLFTDLETFRDRCNTITEQMTLMDRFLLVNQTYSKINCTND